MTMTIIIIIITFTNNNNNNKNRNNLLFFKDKKCISHLTSRFNKVDYLNVVQSSFMCSYSLENVGSDLEAAWTEKKMILVKLLH